MILGVDAMVEPSLGGTIVTLVLSPPLFHGSDYSANLIILKFLEDKRSSINFLQGTAISYHGRISVHGVSRENVDFSARYRIREYPWATIRGIESHAYT